MSDVKHDCDKEIRSSSWAMSGYRDTGDKWTCSCGKEYEYLNDESEGGAWWPTAEEFMKEWDEGQHTLSTEDQKALDAMKPKLFERIRKTL